MKPFILTMILPSMLLVQNSSLYLEIMLSWFLCHSFESFVVDKLHVFNSEIKVIAWWGCEGLQSFRRCLFLPIL